jgi:hypothetical protein
MIKKVIALKRNGLVVLSLGRFERTALTGCEIEDLYSDLDFLQV